MTPEQENERKIDSLAFYFFKFFINKRGDIAENIPLPTKDDLRSVAEAAKANDNSLCDLDDIVVDQSVYDDIAGQIRNQVINDRVGTWLKITYSVSNFFDNYINNVAQNDDTRDAVNAIMGRLNDLLEKDLKQDNPTKRATGLVVGRVQSGKTQNFTGLALKAVSEKWNMILVLTSNNTALADQTKQRLRDDFAASGIQNAHCKELDFSQNDKAVIEDLSVFYWGVAMKETHHLDRVIDCLDKSGQFLDEIKLLVIDDEADNATPNSASGNANLTEDQIKEYIGCLRDTEGGESPEGPETQIANWLERLGELEITEEEEELKNELNNLTANALPAFLDHHRDALKLDADTKKAIPELDDAAKFITVLKSIFEITADQSTINRKIRAIVDRDANDSCYPFKSCAYVGYTATPYANIFHERPDQTPIYPGFIYSLDKGKGYFGLDEIFGSNPQDLKDENRCREPRMPIVCRILEDESQHILARLPEIPYVPIDDKKKPDTQADDKKKPDIQIDENLVVTSGTKKWEWTSLKTMIKWAFCSAATRRHYRLTALAKKGISEEEIKELEKTKARWTSMLVHIDRTRDLHGKVKMWIIDYLNHVTLDAAAQDAFRKDCLDVWDKMKQDLTPEIFQKIFGGNDIFRGVTPTPCPTRETIEPYLNDFIQNCRPDQGAADSKVHVIEINSTPAGKNNQCDYTQSLRYKATEKGRNEHIIRRGNFPVPRLEDDHLWIISGGNTIARGLTLDGLTSSYFDRASKSVAVDTLTQMGRWFGYRRGYELLPRLALTDDTVVEIKRIAVIEDRMHREIRENFDNNIPPDDQAGYLTVYTCGRKLSGRQKALCQSRAGNGVFTTTNHLYHRENENKRIFEKTEEFLGTLGKCFVRDEEEYKYNNYRLWSNIPQDAVRNFLNNVRADYPTKSNLKLEALATEIKEASDNRPWYVVIGEPGGNGATEKFAGQDCRCGEPEPTMTNQNQVAVYNNTRLHLPYYAMIPTSILRGADLYFLRKDKEIIIKKWQKITPLPKDLDDALQAKGKDFAERLNETLDYYKNNDEALLQAIHSLLNSVSQGLRNRSDKDYLAETHKAPYNNPILQIYLIKPPEDQNMMKPLIALTVYWPDHEPTGFVAATLGLSEDLLAVPTRRRTGNNISQEQFYTAVRDILLEAAFPLPPAILTQRVCARLGCDIAPYSAAIQKMQLQYGYRKLPGGHYCPLDWAEKLYQERLASPGLSDEERAVFNEFLAGKLLVRNDIGVEIFWGPKKELLRRPLQKALYDRFNEVALEILKGDSGKEIFTDDLMEKVPEKAPEFGGFSLSATDFNQSFSAYIDKLENNPVEAINWRTAQHASQRRRYVYRQANPENPQEEQ